jgi:hypothetical protein
VTNLTGEQKITLAVRGVVPQRRQAMVTKKPRTSRPGLAVGRRPSHPLAKHLARGTECHRLGDLRSRLCDLAFWLRDCRPRRLI